MTSATVLAHYDPTKELFLAVDASPVGLGAVISHIDDGEERPIAFTSRSLTLNWERRTSDLWLLLSPILIPRSLHDVGSLLIGSQIHLDHGSQTADSDPRSQERHTSARQYKQDHFCRDGQFSCPHTNMKFIITYQRTIKMLTNFHGYLCKRKEVKHVGTQWESYIVGRSTVYLCQYNRFSTLPSVAFRHILCHSIVSRMNLLLNRDVCFMALE